MTRRILIKGGCVLTLSRQGNHPEADVLVEDGVVAAVGQDLRARDAEVVDASGSIVMPGFVDCHRHLSESIFRGLGDLPSTPDPSPDVGPHYRPDDLYASTLIGLLGAAEAGITTVVDWAEIPWEDGLLEAALQAHVDSGLRTVLAHAPAPWKQGLEGWRSGLRHLVEQSPPDRIRFAAGSPRPIGPEAVSGDWSMAREMGLRVHAHVGTEPSDRGVVAALASAGLLGPDVNLVHGTSLGPEDLDAIAAQSATLTLTPCSEMASGLGAPPVQSLIDRGIRPGLGVDTERLGPGDMFAQIRAVIALQHATLFDLKLMGKGGIPNLLSTREVIRYGTIDAARASGMAEETGTLEPGKRADIIVLRTDLPNIAPVNDPIGAVVWGMDTSNLAWVLVDGEPLMREGALQADVRRVAGLAATARERVGAASGLPAGLGSGARG